jgi:hypothetical protein
MPEIERTSMGGRTAWRVPLLPIVGALFAFASMTPSPAITLDAASFAGAGSAGSDSKIPMIDRPPYPDTVFYRKHSN